MNIDCFIPEGCATIIEQVCVAEDTNTTKGTVAQEIFELYTMKKVVPLNGRCNKSEPQSILVVIENATIHQRIHEIIEQPNIKIGGKVIFTTPYRYV